MLQLTRRVHANGQKVVLTGEGADEWLVGYPWYKISKALGMLDLVPCLHLSDRARRAYLNLNHVPQFPAAMRRQSEALIGGPNAWIDAYGLLGLSKLRFYAEPMRKIMEARNPWGDLGLNLERARRWHPMNRGVWVAGCVTLAGLLLQAKGDRVAMNSSVEVRYPFLAISIHDGNSGGDRDKHLLRLPAQRWLPPSVYGRRKVIFRAPLDSFHMNPEPPFVRQLLSDESLKNTGYFDVASVRHWRKAFLEMRQGSLPRLSVEMGLAAVVATQLRHHLFVDGSLADIPAWSAPQERLI